MKSVLAVLFAVVCVAAADASAGLRAPAVAAKPLGLVRVHEVPAPADPAPAGADAPIADAAAAPGVAVAADAAPGDAALSANCGGNCPGNDCPSCPCGSTPSPQNIAAICAQYSGWSQSCCECIVTHESSGNANAVNYNENGSYDIGVFQVNTVNWASCSGGAPPCNVATNLACAIKVFGWGGNSFKYWSTCGACGCC
jgi:hypothetical protein